MPNTNSKPPWQMTRSEWNTARESCRAYGHYTSKPTNSSANEMLARITKLEQLLFGVNDRARDIILANANARDAGLPVPHSAPKVRWARQKLDTYITHRDVIFKALIMRLPVPTDVLADYPDIAARVQRHWERCTPSQP